MSKVKCEGCGVELIITDAEFADEKKAANAAFGEAEVSALCPPCGELVQIAYATAYVAGVSLDGDYVLKSIQRAHQLIRETEADPTAPARHLLIRALWANHKQHGVDYTRNPVAVDHDPFSDDKVVFERKVYAGKTVIEAEGLIVEQL